MQVFRSPLSILSFATTYPRWSQDSEAPFVHDLNRNLAARGHRVISVVPHAPGAARRETMDGVDVVRFRYAPDGLETLFYNGGVMPNLRASWRARLALAPAVAALWAQIAHQVKARAPDLVHVHWLVPQGFFAVGPARRHRKPLVLSAHGADVHQLARGPLSPFAARAISGASSITANTQDTARVVAAKAIPRRIDVIPMGLDLSRFGPHRRDDRARAQLGIRGPWVFAVGRLVEKKGFEYLIDALPDLCQRFAGLKVTLGGAGPLDQALRQRARDRRVDTVIDFVGPLPPERVACYMASADVFVGPSVVDAFGDTEGQGVVFIEAMASGIPVVATSVGGIPDVVEHGRHGLLVPPRDAHALAEAIAATLDDRDGAARRARAGLERARTYAWPAIAERFESLYVDLCAARAAQPATSGQ
jgi:glycosyltransferase involved in cell wall biosynthesis